MLTAVALAALGLITALLGAGWAWVWHNITREAR